MGKGEGKRIVWGLSIALLVAASAVALTGYALLGREGPWVPALFTSPMAILVPVSVGGVEEMFVLDTASETTLVTPRVSDHLRTAGTTVEVFSRPCLEPVRAQAFHAGGIRFAGSRLRFPEEVGSLDLQRLGEAYRRELGGILGWDVLSNYVIGIDVSGKRLLAGRKLTVRKAFESLGAAGADAALSLEMKGGRPAVTIRAAGSELRLLLDTGASMTVISREAWRRTGSPLPLEGPESTGLSIGGSTSRRLGRLDELWLGSLRAGSVEVAVPEDEGCAGAREASGDGLFGMDLIARHLVVIDGPARVLHVGRRAGAT